MNYYTIKSSEPTEYVLDKTKLLYPAHIIDLRTGITSVLENATDAPIIIGGRPAIKQIIASMYCVISSDGYGNETFGPVATLAEINANGSTKDPMDYDYIAIGLFDEGTIDPDKSATMSQLSVDLWQLLPIPVDAVNVVSQSN